MATVVTRRIQCSSARAIEYCRTLPPERVVLAGPTAPGIYSRITAGTVAQMTGTIDNLLRRCAVTVDLDALSPLAREIAESSPGAINAPADVRLSL